MALLQNQLGAAAAAAAAHASQVHQPSTSTEGGTSFSTRGLAVPAEARGGGHKGRAGQDDSKLGSMDHTTAGGTTQAQAGVAAALWLPPARQPPVRHPPATSHLTCGQPPTRRGPPNRRGPSQPPPAEPRARRRRWRWGSRSPGAAPAGPPAHAPCRQAGGRAGRQAGKRAGGWAAGEGRHRQQVKLETCRSL